MRPDVWILICAITVGLLPVAKANAGWLIEQVIRSSAGTPISDGGQDRQVLSMSDNRMKQTTLNRAGKPTAAWIMDLDAQTLTSVDYERQTVATGSVQEYAESMQDAMQATGGQMAEAMKQMQEAMKDMPPEQRQQMGADDAAANAGRGATRECGTG